MDVVRKIDIVGIVQYDILCSVTSVISLDVSEGSTTVLNPATTVLSP